MAKWEKLKKGEKKPSQSFFFFCSVLSITYGERRMGPMRDYSSLEG